MDTPQVRTAFAQRKVVTLRADWTNGDAYITELLRQHGRAGVPLYLYYPPGGPDQVPVVLPELINSQMVLDTIRKG